MKNCSFNNSTAALFMDVVITLNVILVTDRIHIGVKTKVKGNVESPLKFETMLTAQIYLQVFSGTRALSKYPQSMQLNMPTAHQMIEELLENMQILQDNFQAAHDAAAACVPWNNDQLNETGVYLIMEESLPIKRQRRH